MSELNTAVLIIDDEEIVRNSVEDILVPKEASTDSDSINQAFSVLFETSQALTAARPRIIPNFAVDKASNGAEGIRKVREAVERDRPYAVIFVDMRMPGLDGLEAATEIRKYDCKAEIIFLTAYSDHSIEEIIEQAGQNVGYHCKPYAPEEIIQLATKAVTDYDKLRNLESLIESISSIGLNQNQLMSLLKNILNQVTGSLKTDMALIGKIHDNSGYEKVISTGAFDDHIDLDELIARVKNIRIEKDEVKQIDNLVLARMDSYSVFALLKKQESLKTEKMYLLKLFMQHAAQAIRNAELNAQLIQKEKLSAVGQVIGMVIHDLRSPISNIKQTAGLMREVDQPGDLIGMIDQSVEHTLLIFDDLLDFIKENPVKKVPVDLNKIIEAAIRQASAKQGFSRITMIKDIPETLMIPGDENKLERVMVNLLNNAVDAVSNNTGEKGTIRIRAEVQDDNLILHIADNGPGIPAEIGQTLFEPFVTLHKANGTGLGLAIVRRFIAMHGGDVSVACNPGADFRISLPLN
ncbi:ATP-binding protein [Mucilaginibacter sp. BT774]|uniref:sensor histidine kinase n=1 Tax=Mucilaginibacter sp. BT774 TaxID=3062276 RepID=UPI002674BE83|nr:ATP-binding protein [Mucilaginibacter sp. BT774]MDO3627623.1 ATP-binding protein [Mucilaginibacter sp. BT774]